MRMTPEKYVECYKRTGSKVGVARELGIDERNLRRFVKNHKEEIDELLAGDDSPVILLPEKPTDIHQRILKALNKETSVAQLSTDFKVSQRVMQAYIDGIYAATNKDWVTENNFWSSTESKASSGDAYPVYLSHGYTYFYFKTDTLSTRCVRRG